MLISISVELISFVCKIHIKFDIFVIFLLSFLFFLLHGYKKLHYEFLCYSSSVLLMFQPLYARLSTNLLLNLLLFSFQSFILLSISCSSFYKYVMYGDIIRFAFGTVFILYFLSLFLFLSRQ